MKGRDGLEEGGAGLSGPAVGLVTVVFAFLSAATLGGNLLVCLAVVLVSAASALVVVVEA